MSDYTPDKGITPTTDEVRKAWSLHRLDPEWSGYAYHGRGNLPEREFDRWLAEVKREAAAEALELFAERWAVGDGIEALMFAQDDVSAVLLTEKAMLARAAEIRADQNGDE